jgi:hypothetical protein
MGGMMGNLIASGEPIRDKPSLKRDHGQSECQELQLIRVFGTDRRETDRHSRQNSSPAVGRWCG